MVDLWLCSGWVGSGCDSCRKAVKLKVGRMMSIPIGQAVHPMTKPFMAGLLGIGRGWDHCVRGSSWKGLWNP